MRKKTNTIGLIAAATLFAMMSLGSGSTNSAVQKNITVNNTETAESKTEAGGSVLDEKSNDTEVSIEEQVLIDDGEIKLTAVEYVKDSIWGDGIKLLIENNGTSDVGIGCDALIVNDYMITDLFSSQVAAGKKDYETLNLSNSQLQAAGIDNVGKIELYLHCYDSDTYMTTKKYDGVTIRTSLYDHMDVIANDAGQELYNEGGVKIVGKYVDESSFWGAAVLLYIENNSGRNIIVQCDDMSINGFMMTPYFSANVYDGKKAIDDITLMSSELESNNIQSIDDIELKFKIIDENFSTIAESSTISFSAH